MSARELSTQAKTYELEIEIEATPERVWQALTQETNAWWLTDFRMVAPDSEVVFRTEAGGGLVERRTDGGSLLWYTVQMCTPGESLYLVGHLAADFGGPATTMMKLALEARGGATVLRVQDSLVGAFSETAAASLEAGWLQLFGEGLKPHAEA